MIGEQERQQSQMLAESRVLNAGLEASLHQQLEDAPGLESEGVAQEQVTILCLLLEELDEKPRCVVPFPLKDGLPLGESAPALRQPRLVDPRLGISERVLRVQGKGARHIGECRTGLATPGTGSRARTLLFVE